MHNTFLWWLKMFLVYNSLPDYRTFYTLLVKIDLAFDLALLILIIRSIYILWLRNHHFLNYDCLQLISSNSATGKLGDNLHLAANNIHYILCSHKNQPSNHALMLIPSMQSSSSFRSRIDFPELPLRSQYIQLQVATSSPLPTVTPSSLQDLLYQQKSKSHANGNTNQALIDTFIPSLAPKKFNLFQLLMDSKLEMPLPP